MKINMKLAKNIGKMLIITFLVIYCLYILYFSGRTVIENFANKKDCSNCEMRPDSGDCISIYDISYSFIGTNDISFTTIDTGYKFCPWKQNCPELTNIISQEERLTLDMSDNLNTGINDITCCSGISFYNNNTINFSEISTINDNINDCSAIDNKLADIKLNNRQKYKEIIYRYKNSNMDELSKLRSVCNTNSTNLKGMLFDVSLVREENILADPTLKIQEIIDKQNILEMNMNFNNENDKIEKLNEIKILNNELKSLQSNPNDARKIQIQNELSTYYRSDITVNKYKYKLIDKELNVVPDPSNNNDTYILNPGEFFNCFGDISNTNTKSFSDADIKKFEDNNFFGISDGASYTTTQDTTQRLYPNQQDLEMELKNLEKIPPGGNAPTSIITSYLTAINSFYEKQLANMMGPTSHSFNQELVFDNNTLDTKESTFFVYDDSNNDISYECQPSVTGNSKFKSCGPPAYYTEFKA